MKLRVARHTGDLGKIAAFYIDILGFERLGEFKDHAGYDGLFIGLPGKDWHLEFTVSEEQPVHAADEDDLLVFYPDDHRDHQRILKALADAAIAELPAKNPYWQVNGNTFADPDDYHIVIVKV